MTNDEKGLIRIYKSLNDENRKELIAYLLELYREDSYCCNAGSCGIISKEEVETRA